MLSKHNIAFALCSKGHDVFFLNPPSSKVVWKCSVTKYNDINVVNHGSFPSFFKILPRIFSNFIKRLEVFILLKSLNIRFDVVWSFSNYYPSLSLFKCKYKVFHPVDILSDNCSYMGFDSDLIVSVSPSILSRYSQATCNKLFLNHGVNSFYEKFAMSYEISEDLAVYKRKIIVGYIGSLVSQCLDRDLLIKLIQVFKDIDFYFWGPFDFNHNLGGRPSLEVFQFIDKLQGFNNVKLFGVSSSEKIISEWNYVSIWIVCYDISRYKFYDGSNSHKILEYFSSGKVVVSNFIQLYEQYSDLIRMVNLGDSHDSFICLMKDTLQKLEYFNSAKFQKQRISYALSNTYTVQVERILSLLKSNLNA